MAYGHAQEDYLQQAIMSRGKTRGRKSGICFNEYLQAAVEWGVPLTLCGLAAIVMCLYIGIKKRRYGICGAILSLMYFFFFFLSAATSGIYCYIYSVAFGLCLWK